MDIVFFVGSGRCGSSLVHEIVAKHEDAGFISNIDDRLSSLNLKGGWNSRIYRSPVGRFTRKGALRFAPSEAYDVFSSRVSPLYVDSDRDLEARDVTPWLEKRTKAFFEERHARQGKAVFTHKYTGWPRLGFFAKIFPNAKFVHIVRDGRAVANSFLQMSWWGGYRGPENWHCGALQEPYLSEWLESDRSYTVLAGLNWKILMDSFERTSPSIPQDQYLEMRYEDILEDSRQCFERMMQFCGLSWTPDFDKHFMARTITAARGRAFERDLSSEQLQELNRCLAGTLEKLGYS